MMMVVLNANINDYHDDGGPKSQYKRLS